MSDGNRLLMSDSLKGVVPELEDDMIRKLEDAFVAVSFQLTHGDESEVLTAALLGCAVEEGMTRVDFRLDTFDAYRWFSSFVKDQWRCEVVIFSHSERLLEIPGPFRVKCPKITDIDRKDKISTIGVDLFRI